MKALIETLRVQHEEIGRRIEAIEDALHREDASAVRRELDALATALLAHLAIEDAHLYPALSESASKSGHAIPAKLAATYEHNMKTISVALRAFLEAYGGHFKLDDFRRDWILVSQLLTDRIASEEATLYPLYAAWHSRAQLDD